MNYQTITQIIMVVISVALIMTYISPKFSDIQVIQSQTNTFKDAVDKAAQSNALLQQRLQEINSISQADLEALDLFLPNELDSVRVARDIQLIAEAAEMDLQSLAYGEPSQVEAQAAVPADLDQAAADSTGLPGVVSEVKAPSLIMQRQEFTVDVYGTYEQFKQFLRIIEANAYPLYLTNLSFSGEEEESGELQTFSVTFDSFALNSQPQ